MPDLSRYLRACRPVIMRMPDSSGSKEPVLVGSLVDYVARRTYLSHIKLKTVWIWFQNSPFRHRAFVPDEIDLGTGEGIAQAILLGAEALYYRYALDEKRFPLKIELFDSVQAAEPLGAITVGLAYKETEDDIVAVFGQVKPDGKVVEPSIDE